MRKVFVLDTNIILNDANVVETLSENGKNIIILPAPVQDEIDIKKNGNEFINLQARIFNRISEDCTNDEPEELDGIADRIKVYYKDNIEMHLIELKNYDCLKENLDYHIKEDRKIIETAEKIKSFYKEYDDFLIISNDVSFRRRALYRKLKTRPFKIHNIVSSDSIEFIKEIFITDDSIIKEYNLISDLVKEEINNSISSFIITNTVTGKKFYGIKENNMIKILPEYGKGKEALKQKHFILPVNTEQKFYYSLMLSDFYDIIITDSKAGTGKTILALSAACHLLDTQQDKYQKIIYTRKTVISGDRQDEIGFLKGGIEDKLAGFLGPLDSSIEEFVMPKNLETRVNKAEIDALKENFKKEYNIEFSYQGHLRGKTYNNTIFILDEEQSNSIKEAQTLLTRMGKNCKIFILGSSRQIDNQYLNKQNNALTFLLNKTTEENDKVKLAGIKLIKTERSDIAEWADEFNQPKRSETTEFGKQF